jgi:hypothetical protein
MLTDKELMGTGNTAQLPKPLNELGETKEAKLDVNETGLLFPLCLASATDFRPEDWDAVVAGKVSLAELAAGEGDTLGEAEAEAEAAGRCSGCEPSLDWAFSCSCSRRSFSSRI